MKRLSLYSIDEDLSWDIPYQRYESDRMLLKGIIFDLDGVLVDTVPAHFAAWRRMLTEEGFAFDEEIYYHSLDGRRLHDGAVAVMKGADPHLVRTASKRKEGYFLELIEQGQLRVFDSSIKFLMACRDSGLRLATASSSSNARYILAKAGILDAFQVVIGGDDVEFGKPDPGVFLAAAKGIGLGASDCIVIEDAVSGVRAAKAGGFFCVGIDRAGRSGRLAAADILVDDLGQLDLNQLGQSFERSITARSANRSLRNPRNP